NHLASGHLKRNVPQRPDRLIIIVAPRRAPQEAAECLAKLRALHTATYPIALGESGNFYAVPWCHDAQMMSAKTCSVRLKYSKPPMNRSNVISAENPSISQ